MAKRESGGTQVKAADTTAAASDTTAAKDAMEQRVIAFAEQLGRIYGTVQAKAEGWMDRETLNTQIASVRDGAAERWVLRDDPGRRHRRRADQGSHRRTTPAATLLPGLVIVCIHSVTSLGGFTLRPNSVCLRLPPEHSFCAKPIAQFQQVELRSARLPFDNECLHFGAVSEWTDWLALTGFVELSYSQRAIFGRTPTEVLRRF